MSNMEIPQHAETHLPDGSDPLPLGAGMPPYVSYLATDLVTIPDGSIGVSPTIDVGNSEYFLSVPDPILIGTSGDGPRSILLGQARLVIDDPGVTGATGALGVYGSYNMQLVHAPGAYGWLSGSVGVGFTAPGGVPYLAVFSGREGMSFGYSTIYVPNVTDPLAGDYYNQARPDWPAAYQPGDILFSGIWNIPLVTD